MIASQLWLASNEPAAQTTDGRDHVVDLRNYTATYRIWGGGPPLVLVPGLAGSYGLLELFARELGRTHLVIAPALRAEEDCFALRRSFGICDLADDLRQFIEAVGLERPAVCGVSFGGIVAAELAATHPHRLSALILQGVGDRYERGLLQRIARIVLSDYPLPSDNQFVNQFFNLLMGRKQPAELVRFVAKHCWRTDQSVIAHRLRLVERFELSTRLGRIVAPTLAVAGDRDMLVTAAHLRRLCGGMRHAKAVAIRDGGHLACVTHARVLADEVSRFLGRQFSHTSPENPA